MSSSWRKTRVLKLIAASALLHIGVRTASEAAAKTQSELEAVGFKAFHAKKFIRVVQELLERQEGRQQPKPSRKRVEQQRSAGSAQSSTEAKKKGRM